MMNAFLVCALIGVVTGLVGAWLEWPGWFSAWLAFILGLSYMIIVGGKQ